MKFSKLFAIASVLAMVYSAFSDAGNALIAYSTPGPDKYADGSTVLNGEWYALVWSSDGVFDGFTPDCKAVDTNDDVVVVAPLAKDRHCPYTVFQVDTKSSHYKTNGVYAVYLLDTRSADKQTVAGKTKAGIPESVNGVIANSNFDAFASRAGGAIPTAAGGVWGESSDDGLVQPIITGIEPLGAKVLITVENLLPAVKYNVKMGEEIANLDSYGLTTPTSKVDSATFEIQSKDARFFQVVREPLARVEKEEK